MKMKKKMLRRGSSIFIAMSVLLLFCGCGQQNVDTGNSSVSEITEDMTGAQEKGDEEPTAVAQNEDVRAESEENPVGDTSENHVDSEESENADVTDVDGLSDTNQESEEDDMNGKSWEETGIIPSLAVNGTDLVRADNGEPVQLRGVSTHGIAWFPQYVNTNAFRTLRDDWGANLIRLAMYTYEYAGYCTDGNKEELEQLIDQGVNSATELGMYVIVDWHVLQDQTPLQYQAEAEDFFSRMSAKYADHTNVLYEICNEPNGATTWSDVKQYAESVISIIRANDPDAVILVGSPTWSQDVDLAAADPITTSDNLMYTLHFYAATHKDDLRGKLQSARAAGLPIFISEFSICDASGNGAVDYDSATAWKQLIMDNNLSYAGWSLSNKDESSALLKPSVQDTQGNWSESDLSETGTWLRQTIRESAGLN